MASVAERPSAFCVAATTLGGRVEQDDVIEAAARVLGNDGLDTVGPERWRLDDHRAFDGADGVGDCPRYADQHDLAGHPLGQQPASS